MSTYPVTAFDLAARLGLAAFHTGVTLWYRIPILMAAGTKERDIAELNRMVGEKVIAASRGLIDAQVELVRLTAAAATGRLTQAKISGAGTALADAALRPSLRTVKRNARRLPRKRRKT